MTMTLDGSAGMTVPSGAVYNGLQTATAANASGASVDFTNIPVWAKRITVILSGVSLTTSDFFQVRLGSGSIQTSGYLSGAWSNSTNAVTSTSAFYLIANNSASNTWHGTAVLHNISGNIWVCSVVMGTTGPSSVTASGGGSVTLTGALDRLRVLNDGAGTFDAGTINIMYE